MLKRIVGGSTGTKLALVVLAVAVAKWFNLWAALVVVGLGLYLYGVIGLVWQGAVWLAKRIRGVLPWLAVVLVAGIVAVPGESEAAKSSEVRQTCHTRTMYQAGADHSSTWWGSRIWTLRLCADFDHWKDGTKKGVNPLPPATVSWTPHGPYKPMWSADNCTAWISPETADGQYMVKAKCTVKFAVLPFTQILKGDILQRDIWVGFTVGHNYTDYWYSSRVNYYGETTSDPLPFSSPSDMEDMHLYPRNQW